MIAWVLIVAVLVQGEWHYQQRGPFHTQEQCEAANVRILQCEVVNVRMMMQAMNSSHGMIAKGDCGIRL